MCLVGRLVWSHMFVAMYLYFPYLVFLVFPFPSLHSSQCELFIITPFLERLLKSFRFKICHVHSIFILVGFFSCFCMVILLVEWHTVCATLCSEVNYIKLNAVYVLATHPKLHQIHTHTISNIFHVFS